MFYDNKKKANSILSYLRTGEIERNERLTVKNILYIVNKYFELEDEVNMNSWRNAGLDRMIKNAIPINQLEKEIEELKPFLNGEKNIDNVIREKKGPIKYKKAKISNTTDNRQVLKEIIELREVMLDYIYGDELDEFFGDVIDDEKKTELEEELENLKFKYQKQTENYDNLIAAHNELQREYDEFKLRHLEEVSSMVTRAKYDDLLSRMQVVKNELEYLKSNIGFNNNVEI